jgi:hypothetical protein
MEAYENSFIEKEEFDFENYLPYFKKPIDYTRSKYETLMDPLSDKIQHLPKSKQTKYKKLMVNITYSSFECFIKNDRKRY